MRVIRGLRDTLSRYFLLPVGHTLSGRSYFSAKAYQKLLEKRQYSSLEELNQCQNGRLQRMIRHAFDNVPYYKNLFRSQGISPSDIESVADLKCIPFLTKDVLNRSLQELVALNARKDHLRLESTGGTTGTPTNFYTDLTCAYECDGNMWRLYNYCGYRPGMGIATFWGNEQDLSKGLDLRGRLKAVMDNTMVFNFYDLSEEKLRIYVEKIRAKKLEYWRGFSSALYVFMRYLKRNNLDVPLPKAVIITSDKIDDVQREEMDSFFENNVFNEYGCREISGIMGFECEAHRGIHIAIENIVIEIVNNKDTEEYGEVVITSLTNWGMPLIRYKLGDASKYLEKRCTCGRNLPSLESIRGRIADFVVTKSEKLIYGDFFAHLFYGFNGIEHYQVVQNEVGKVLIYVQKNETYHEGVIHSFLDKLNEMTGRDLEAEVILTPVIESQRSGKRRSVISEVSKSFMP